MFCVFQFQLDYCCNLPLFSMFLATVPYLFHVEFLTSSEHRSALLDDGKK